jgi:hypothetical protein
MGNKLKLYLILLGCKPLGRFIEQHDIFFGIGKNLKDLIPEIKNFWPEAQGQLHIDAWREVTNVNNYSIEVVTKKSTDGLNNLFFINLGGYKENEFEEYHYKILSVAKNISSATRNAKTTAFYKHCSFKGAPSHIDDTYGIDVDYIYNVSDILSKQYKEMYSLKLSKIESSKEDHLHIGYLKIKF